MKNIDKYQIRFQSEKLWQVWLKAAKISLVQKINNYLRCRVLKHFQHVSQVGLIQKERNKRWWLLLRQQSNRKVLVPFNWVNRHVIILSTELVHGQSKWSPTNTCCNVAIKRPRGELMFYNFVQKVIHPRTNRQTDLPSMSYCIKGQKEEISKCVCAPNIR